MMLEIREIYYTKFYIFMFNDLKTKTLNFVVNNKYSDIFTKKLKNLDCNLVIK